MRKLDSTRTLLMAIAALLAANLIATLMRPAASAPAVSFVPAAQAQTGQVMRIEGGEFVTTNEKGDVIYIWRLGRFVNDGYESVKARTYYASAAN